MPKKAKSSKSSRKYWPDKETFDFMTGMPSEKRICGTKLSLKSSFTLDDFLERKSGSLLPSETED